MEQGTFVENTKSRTVADGDRQWGQQKKVYNRRHVEKTNSCVLLETNWSKPCWKYMVSGAKYVEDKTEIVTLLELKPKIVFGTKQNWPCCVSEINRGH